MKSFRHWFKKHWAVITLITLIFALFFTIRYFIHSIEQSYSEGQLRPVYYYHHNGRTPVFQQRTPQKLTANTIQPWMTFDYINFVFKMPPSYLKNILGITDTRYPNIRIDRYAKIYQIDQTVLLTTIKKYVTTFTAQ